MVSPSLKELPSSLPPPANHSESERGRGSYFAPFNAYSAVLATSPVPHSACRQLHAIDGRFGRTLAIRAARRRRTVASRMRTLSTFLLGHRKPSWLLFQLSKVQYAN